MAKFTAKFVENVKPGPVRRELPDGGCAGLYLISQPSGVRSWAVRYRFNGKSVKLTLGQWPAMTLAAAREATTTAQRALAQGNNPSKTRQDAKIRAAAAEADTVANVCSSYMRREASKLRTAGQRESILKRHVLPHIGDRPIADVRRSEIVRLLDQIEDKSGQRMADVTLAVLRKIMNWHAARTDDFVPPFVRGMGRQNAKDHRRDRILSDDEIRRVWSATADNTPFSALIRFLLSTGARRNEAAGMKWEEVDANGIWRLPPARSKTKVEVVRPLSTAAQEVLAELPQIDGSPYPFSSNSITPIASFSGPKTKLDAASGVVGYTIHDLRRTARSLLSRAAVNSDVAEKCLGHSRGDIIERYDRHEYLDEMRRAFEALAALIDRIVNPPSGEIADIVAERSKRQPRRSRS
jgi:integrase